MAVAQHKVIDAQKVANTFAGLAFDDLVIAQFMTTTPFERFHGTEKSSVSVKVPTLLPARRYAMRNDRTDPIEYDVYEEQERTLNLEGGHIYSGVKIIDEQVDFDNIQANTLIPVQATAVTRDVEYLSADAIAKAPHPVTIGGTEKNHWRSLLIARNVLDKLRVDGQRILLVGSDYEMSLLDDKRFTTSISAGDGRADSALGNATIGSLAGFTVVRSNLVEPGTAYALTTSSFFSATATPYIPQGVPFGASASYRGYTLRWLQDYDVDRFYNRSVVDFYYGVSHVLDHQFVLRDEEFKSIDKKVGHQERVLDGDFYLRSIKLTLDGTSELGLASQSPDGAGGFKGATLASALKITESGITVPAAAA